MILVLRGWRCSCLWCRWCSRRSCVFDSWPISRLNKSLLFGSIFRLNRSLFPKVGAKSLAPMLLLNVAAPLSMPMDTPCAALPMVFRWGLFTIFCPVW